MEELKALIQQVDDDYLIGLSNKGTLKRALKDLEQETPSFTWEEGAARVALKEETCVIRAPLGESSCSCPSRSVCRHIITAVLFLKRELAGSSVKKAPEVKDIRRRRRETAAQCRAASRMRLTVQARHRVQRRQSRARRRRQGKKQRRRVQRL